MAGLSETEIEIGQQRRRNRSGRPLHCCCICQKLDVWGDGWSWFGSYKDEEDCVPLPKFCSARCQERGGEDAKHVTREMLIAAKAKEWREPNPVPPRPRSYADALYEQTADSAALNEKG